MVCVDASMCAYAVTCSLAKSAVAVCNLYRVQSKLPIRWLCSPTARQGKYKCFVTQGIAGQLQPESLYSGMSRNQMPMVVISSQHVALSQMVNSCVRRHVVLNARFGFLSQENCHFNCVAVGASEGTACDQRSDTRLWHRLKHALFACMPVTHADDLLTYFSAVQQQSTTSRSFHSSTCSMSQKPDKDPGQKPTASQLHNVQQLMTELVMQFFYCITLCKHSLSLLVVFIC